MRRLGHLGLQLLLLHTEFPLQYFVPGPSLLDLALEPANFLLPLPTPLPEPAHLLLKPPNPLIPPLQYLLKLLIFHTQLCREIIQLFLGLTVLPLEAFSLALLFSDFVVFHYHAFLVLGFHLLEF